VPHAPLRSFAAQTLGVSHVRLCMAVSISSGADLEIISIDSTLDRDLLSKNGRYNLIQIYIKTMSNIV